MSTLQLFNCGRSISEQSAAENDLYENQFTNMSCQKMLLFIVDYETERLLIKAILNNIEIILYFGSYAQFYIIIAFAYSCNSIPHNEKGLYVIYIYSNKNCVSLV